jgi:hypothetical protein
MLTRIPEEVNLARLHIEQQHYKMLYEGESTSMEAAFINGFITRNGLKSTDKPLAYTLLKDVLVPAEYVGMLPFLYAAAFHFDQYVPDNDMGEIQQCFYCLANLSDSEPHSKECLHIHAKRIVSRIFLADDCSLLIPVKVYVPKAPETVEAHIVRPNGEVMRPFQYGNVAGVVLYDPDADVFLPSVKKFKGMAEAEAYARKATGQ